MSLITNKVKFQNVAYVWNWQSNVSLQNSSCLEAQQMKLMTFTYIHIYCTTANIAIFMFLCEKVI